MTHKGGRLLSTLVCFLFSYLTLTKGCLTLLREATFSLFNMVVDPIPKLRFVLCAIRDTNEHIGQLILLQLELISIPFE